MLAERITYSRRRSDATLRYTRRRRQQRWASCAGALKDTPRARIVITTRPLGAMAAGWLSHLSGLFYSRCCYNRFLVPHASGLPLPPYLTCARLCFLLPYVRPPLSPPSGRPRPTARRPPSALCLRDFVFPCSPPVFPQKMIVGSCLDAIYCRSEQFPDFSLGRNERRPTRFSARHDGVMQQRRRMAISLIAILSNGRRWLKNNRTSYVYVHTCIIFLINF